MDREAVDGTEFHIGTCLGQVLNRLDIQTGGAELRMRNDDFIKTGGNAIVVHGQDLLPADMPRPQYRIVIARQLDYPLGLVRQRTVLGNRVEPLVKNGDRCPWWGLSGRCELHRHGLEAVSSGASKSLRMSLRVECRQPDHLSAEPQRHLHRAWVNPAAAPVERDRGKDL